MNDFGLTKFIDNAHSVIDSVFDNLDFKGFNDSINKLFDFDDNSNWMKLYPAFQEKDGKYEINVDYNAENDDIKVNLDKKKRELRVTVYSHTGEGTDIVSTKYGRFVTPISDECNIDTMKRNYDNEKHIMTFTFDKSVKAENKKDDVQSVVNGTNDKPNYEKMYNDLLTKYKSLSDKNDKLSEKMKLIKDLF